MKTRVLPLQTFQDILAEYRIFTGSVKKYFLKAFFNKKETNKST